MVLGEGGIEEKQATKKRKESRLIKKKKNMGPFGLLDFRTFGLAGFRAFGLCFYIYPTRPPNGAKKKPTAPSVPKWSPTSVLTGPDQV